MFLLSYKLENFFEPALQLNFLPFLLEPSLDLLIKQIGPMNEASYGCQLPFINFRLATMIEKSILIDKI